MPISNFFSKQTKCDKTVTSETVSVSASASSSSEKIQSKPTVEIGNGSAPTDTCSTVDPTTLASHPNDIGQFIDHINLSAAEKVMTLDNLWTPHANYSFPVVDRYSDKKKLKFQYGWLLEFPWLSYSEKEKGAFCKYCVFFSKSGAGYNSQELGALCKKKFDNWKKAKDTFRYHGATSYHIGCMTDYSKLREIISQGKGEPIINQLETDRKQKIESNRKALVPIIDAVILCSRQDLALRVHGDLGKLDLPGAVQSSEKNWFQMGSEGFFPKIMGSIIFKSPF